MVIFALYGEIKAGVNVKSSFMVYTEICDKAESFRIREDIISSGRYLGSMCQTCVVIFLVSEFLSLVSHVNQVETLDIFGDFSHISQCAIKISQNEDWSFGLLLDVIFNDSEEFISSFQSIFVTVSSSMEVDIID